MLMIVFYLEFIPVIVHSLLFEAYKLVYFVLFFFSLYNVPRLAYAICELYMFFF